MSGAVKSRPCACGDHRYRTAAVRGYGQKDGSWLCHSWTLCEEVTPTGARIPLAKATARP